MNRERDENLDRLLRDWAAGAQPDEAHLEALRERISQAADQLEGAGAEVISVPKAAPTATWPRRLAWFTLGAAAAAAILAAVVVLSRLGPRQGTDTSGEELAEVPPEARLDRRELVAQATLLAAMKEVFADRLTWLAETDGRVVLGIESEARASPDGSQPITVRLVVMSRRPGETTWRHRWNVDCIAQDEQLVELAPQGGPQTRVALWAHLLPDGMIAVDTNLDLGARDEGRDPQRSTLDTQLFEPQVPQRILDLRADDVEYRVFQTVAVLPKEVG
ncbi:MAG: hypothetical protein ACYSWU_25255 [Planctomycetota bacterium]|jgi:hypothetical protein